MSIGRKSTLWTWLTLALVLLPILYVFSFGPACWLSTRELIDPNSVASLYQPVLMSAMRGPLWLRRSALSFAAWGSDPRSRVYFSLSKVDGGYDVGFGFQSR